MESDLFKCVCLNARSVRNKLPELHYLLYNGKLDMLIVTESWLDNSITDTILDPDHKFNVFRCDREGGGGVCVFVRRIFSTVKVDVINSPNLKLLELVCLDVFFDCIAYRFFAVYRPPPRNSASGLEYMSRLIECMEIHHNTKGPTIITGDFNCPNIDWSSNVAPSENLQSIFFNFIITNGYVQVIALPMRLNNSLDLLCVNEPLLLSKFCIEPLLGDSDHDSIYFDIMAPETAPTDSDVPTLRYLWNEADYASMSQFLINFN
jgi:hypothetical protein